MLLACRPSSGTLAHCRVHLSIPGAGETPETWGRNFHFQVVEKGAPGA